MTRKELQAVQVVVHLGTLMSHRLYDLGTREVLDEDTAAEQKVLISLHDRWQDAARIFREKPPTVDREGPTP